MKDVDKTNSKTIRLPGYLLFFAFLGIALISNCAASSAPAGQNEIKPRENIKTTQIIIKFRENVTNPSEKTFLKELSRHAQAEVSYIRPMSGGAHVFAVADVRDEETLKKIIKQLYQRPEIIYVQQDKIMRHQIK